MILSVVPSIIKYRNDFNYGCLGASGAISSIVFSFILYNPLTNIYFFFFPLPAIIYGILYLGYCVYASKTAGALHAENDKALL